MRGLLLAFASIAIGAACLPYSHAYAQEPARAAGHEAASFSESHVAAGIEFAVAYGFAPGPRNSMPRPDTIAAQLAQRTGMSQEAANRLGALIDEEMALRAATMVRDIGLIIARNLTENTLQSLNGHLRAPHGDCWVRMSRGDILASAQCRDDASWSQVEERRLGDFLQSEEFRAFSAVATTLLTECEASARTAVRAAIQTALARARGEGIVPM